MKYMVQYSKSAIRDLERVWTEVLEVSKSYEIAAKYIEDLMDKVESKVNYPKSCSPLYFEDSFTGYYFIIFKAYLAFFRLEGDTMLVDRVLFGRSDYMRSLHFKLDDEA